MRVVITGGGGLIGRHLAADLAENGHEVVVLSRNPAQVTGMAKGVQIVRWDGRTADGWEQWADGAGAVVNLAGENIGSSRWTDERKRRILESRTNAGQAVAQAVERARVKPRVVVQASAVGYYGPRGDETVTEEDKPGSDFLSQVVVAWEASTRPVEALGVRRAVARTGIVLSAEGGALPRLLVPIKLFVGGKLASGQQGFPWIHIADEVAALRFLIENEQASGPFNLSAPNPPSNAEFIKAVGQALGRPTALPVPGFALKLAFGEMSTVLLDGQRAAPKRLLDLGFTFRFVDPALAVRDLVGK